MNIKECLDRYQSTGIRHFRLIYFCIPYDVIIDQSSVFSLLDWKITMRRNTPMGIIEDCEVWDEDLIKLLEESEEWKIV